jgi:hypothetical protein
MLETVSTAECLLDVLGETSADVADSLPSISLARIRDQPLQGQALKAMKVRPPVDKMPSVLELASS